MGRRGHEISHRRPDWSSFGTDITEVILKKLSVSDLIRCRDVCRLWYSVSHALISSSPINSPVLVLPKHHLPKELCSDLHESYFFKADSEPTQLCCFFNPVAYELYRISDKLRELLKMKSFVASTNGWALFKGSIDLVLFNAPTGVTIRVPCPAGYGDLIPMKKTVLWGDPILDRKRNRYGLVVAANGGLSFARYGDTTFRYCVHSVYPCDVICFDKLVYAVLEGGFIQAWDFNRLEKDVIERGSDCSPTRVEHYQPSFNCGRELVWYHGLHLVDSLGELCLVSWSRRVVVGVYKLDLEEKKWVDMDSLGGRAVFLGENQDAIGFSPEDPSKYKRNCVYFEEDETRLIMGAGVYVCSIKAGLAVDPWRSLRT